MYRELRATAESGWDFSTRWMLGHSISDLASLRTTQLLPVDLNAILFRVEQTLSALCDRLGDSAGGRFFSDAATARAAAIRTYLWHPADAQWYDYDLETKTPHIRVAVSNYVPLWAGGPLLMGAAEGPGRGAVSSGGEVEASLERADVLERVCNSLRDNSGLLQDAGVATTVHKTGGGQQWDWPNAWAPMQWLLIDGLGRLSTDCRKLARELATRWVGTSAAAWRKTGFMYEKYDATNFGHGGGGGEYVPQVGFGWSNGVVLDLLKRYPDLHVVGVVGTETDGRATGPGASEEDVYSGSSWRWAYVIKLGVFGTASCFLGAGSIVFRGYFIRGTRAKRGGLEETGASSNQLS